ncbi:uncharacterized protein BDR25DRAFT_125836 [Lindgomyces ingoldianus]|uniref:Uncharacterized protein n=1 Tax=Lindgomyces ingoldianus TaxID=673940 RepID=A0ACB6R3L8_9PLEO|nr:uncharacterized protein BDR25DRAFT_125836 [Lindgomyces ingoldianus]KAF2473883.1 hypothetical protein BDR25DRAFT_125836 [Lindgomyces ingoldianus]
MLFRNRFESLVEYFFLDTPLQLPIVLRYLVIICIRYYILVPRSCLAVHLPLSRRRTMNPRRGSSP